MFDELDNKNTAPATDAKPLGPSGPTFGLATPVVPATPVAPAKAEDIFAEVDQTAKPDVFKSKPGSEPPRGTVRPAATGWKSNKIAVLGLLFGGVIVVAAGGYFGLRLAVKGSPAANNGSVIPEQIQNTEPEPGNQPAEEVNNGNNNLNEADNTVVEPVQPVKPEPIDSDGDGLNDDEEISFGTDPNNSDTDQDGLTDREEVKVYTTDSLKADTDGDGFKDGDEVKNGYNPKGAGKLLEINQ